MNDQELKLILMRRISGGGKSTVVRNIVKENNISYLDCVFSTDDFFIPKTLSFLYGEEKEYLWQDLCHIWYKSPYCKLKEESESLFSYFSILIHDCKFDEARNLTLENIGLFNSLEYRTNFDFAKLGYAHKQNYIKFETAITKCTPLIIVDNQNVCMKDMRPYAELALDHGYSIDIKYPESPIWKKYAGGLSDKYKYKNLMAEFALKLFENGTHGVPLETITKNIAKWEDICSSKLIEHVKKYKKE